MLKELPSTKMVVLFVGVLITRALLIGVFLGP